MTYQLKEIVIRTNNSEEGMAKIGELWADVFSGKIPVFMDSSQQPTGVILVSRYSNYESNEQGDYDLGILGVSEQFVGEMESKVRAGGYRKYEEADEHGDIGACTQKAWKKVWMEQSNGDIVRTFTEDYEMSVPAHISPDGCAHCTLYIAVK